MGVAHAQVLHTVEVDDPSGHALDRFRASLRKTAANEAGHITRVAHYGDSLVVVDELTATLRRLYQTRYGAGGPGFVLTAPPWSWYRRVGVRQSVSSGWTIHRSISGGPPDRSFGYGGVSFSAVGSRREARFRTTSVGEERVVISRLDVHYLAQPRGGSFEIVVDGERRALVRTAAERAMSAFQTVDLPSGPHDVILRTLGVAPVRIFGVALERDGPGVVYDSLGLNGTCMTVLGRMNPDHWAEQFARRRPALVVLTFGACETKRPGLVRRYGALVRPILKTLRRVSPTASCLVMGPMDRGQRSGPRLRASNPLVPTVVELQRTAAHEAGCAFWDSFAAMGGAGSIARWRKAGLVRGDMTHPTRRGAEVIGRGLFEALERATSGEGDEARHLRDTP